MSRRALEHDHIKQRYRAAELLARGIVVPKIPDEDPPGTFPYRCNRETMDLGNILFSNLKTSTYYNEECPLLDTFEDIVEEIVAKVDHLEPYATVPANVPSTAFCLLYRMFVMRLTEAQLNTLVTHDNTQVRALGFLYLRYTAHPDTMWEWLRDFIDDPTPLYAKRVAAHVARVEEATGLYVRRLLLDTKYYQVLFPRIPVMKERDIRIFLDNKPYNPLRYELGDDFDEAKHGQGAQRKDSSPKSDGPEYGRSRHSRSRSPADRRDRDRRRSRSRSPSDRRDRDRDRDRRRSRSRSPDRRRRSRSRSRSPRRDRDRDRRRSRSRSPDRRDKDRRRSRSRSPDRRRHRSRSRSRSPRRDRDRRSRSRSRDRTTSSSSSSSSRRDKDGKRDDRTADRKIVTYD